MAEELLLRDHLRTAADRWGGRRAVIDDAVELTYAQLAAAARDVADQLLSAGVRSGDCVAWHGRKNAAAVTAVHGILEAGAAYVPLDPEAPFARNHRIVANGRPSAVLTDTATRRQWEAAGLGLCWEPLKPFAGTVDELWLAALSGSRPSGHPGVSYVLHTSGSSGSPKGVVHTHRSAAAFVCWAAEELALTEADVLVNTAPLHFDLSTLDLFGAAFTGAAVAVMSREDSRFPASYADFVARVGGSVWYTVPSALSRLVQRGDSLLRTFTSLRIAALAGEVLRPDDVGKLMDAHPAARVFNLYGPTETNVCTYHEIVERPPAHQAIPIGRPLPGVEITVVDDRLQPVGEGRTGELLVRGSTLMTGYWKGSAEKLLPFVTTPDGKEWYATGDQVRSGSGGCLDYLGRNDTQIKSRGYRIELVEIDHALGSLPAVAECAVVAIPDGAAGRRILAFAVSEDGGTDEAGLRMALRRLLPGYMVPDRIFVTGRPLPRLTNGKVDRIALTAEAEVLASSSEGQG
ncbi:hypothetical protein GCM10022403_000040 [Streptomyces coacervatus]|uniref:Amino acid adenylation domain-containing protein n=1 Tax=Streptomyces coacervatus TaxID=647381 RepID=A0ABP7GLF9_9ACTN|nr:amino acid adenylation domain-containing protein [Streptomyces coacervatus]MDF2265056.1 amino acid adenylation domain-containing protein [Streptomyces coacervatus]